MFDNDPKEIYVQKLNDLQDVDNTLLQLEDNYVQSLDDDLKKKRKDVLIKEHLEPIINKAKEDGKILGDILEYNEELLKKENSVNYNKIKEFNNLKDKIKKMNDMNRKNLENGDLKFRKAQIIRYQNFIYEQTIHLLFVLVFVLIICILVLTTTILRKLDKYFCYLGIIAIIVLYIFYLVKLLFIDTVSISSHHHRKLYFNNPTDDEIESGRELETNLTNNKKDSCKKDIDHGKELVFQKEDKILEMVKMNTTPDATKCLVTE